MILFIFFGKKKEKKYLFRFKICRKISEKITFDKLTPNLFNFYFILKGSKTKVVSFAPETDSYNNEDHGEENHGKEKSHPKKTQTNTSLGFILF